MKEQVEEYAEEHDLNQTDAMRALLQRGIDYERGRLAEPNDAAGGNSGGDRERLLNRVRLGYWLAGGMVVPFVVSAVLFFAVAPLPMFQMFGALSLLVSWGAIVHTYATLSQIAVRDADIDSRLAHVRRTLQLAVETFPGGGRG
jgi:hypothetical protein